MLFYSHAILPTLLPLSVTLVLNHLISNSMYDRGSNITTRKSKTHRFGFPAKKRNQYTKEISKKGLS